MNTREKLIAIADWLGWQDENLSFGLRSVADAERLYDHWQAHAAELPEMTDEAWFSPSGEEVDRIDIAARRRVVLGYDPLNSEV